jgi:hypothetical protein
LPLSRYIDCDCNNNLLALVKDGHESPGSDQLAELWEALNIEYLELSGEGEENYLLKLSFEIQQLTVKHRVILECVEALENYHIQELVDILKAAGNNFKFDPDNAETYRNDLKRCVTRANTLLTLINDKKAQFDKLNVNQSEGEVKKRDRTYWDMWIVILSEFSKYAINEETTTVSKFLLMRNRFYSYCEQLNAQTNAR